MNFLQMCVLVMLIYLCIYSIISRICKCLEHCATCKSFDKFHKSEQETQK